MLDTRTLLRIAAWIVLGAAMVGGLGFGLLAALEGTSAAGGRFWDLDGRWLAVGSLVWTLALGVQSERWRALIPHDGPRPVELAALVAGTNVLNLALPGPVGEVAAAWYLHRRWSVPFPVALGSSILARLLALFLLGALGLALAPWVPGGGTLRAVLVAGLGLGGFSLGVVVWRPDLVLGLLARLPLPGRLRGRLGWLRETLMTLGGLGWGRWARAGAWGLLNIAILWFGVGTGFWASGSDPHPFGLLLVHVLGSLGVVASILAPGGLGAVEAIYIGLHGTLGVSVEQAVFGAVAVRWVQLGSLAICVAPLLYVARRIDRADLVAASRELRRLPGEQNSNTGGGGS